jgi:hypothetical protein
MRGNRYLRDGELRETGIRKTDFRPDLRGNILNGSAHARISFNVYTAAASRASSWTRDQIVSASNEFEIAQDSRKQKRSDYLEKH